jgi:hypothetical protein
LETGIEWLNDSTLHLIFPSPKEALLSLSLLAKAGFDPSEGDDPLLERSAHSFPISLLPTAPVDSLAETELLPSQPVEEGIRRKGRGAFTNGETGAGAFDLAPLVPVEKEGGDDWNLAEGVDPNARVGIRFGLDGDMDLRGNAKTSDWYRRNGRHAGKEVAAGRRSVGGYGERDEGLSWKTTAGNGEGKEFAKRLGRAPGPYDRRERGNDGRRGKGRTTEDLDRELEGIRGGGVGLDGDVEMGSDERAGGRRRGERGGRREEPKKDDLDKGVSFPNVFIVHAEQDIQNLMTCSHPGQRHDSICILHFRDLCVTPDSWPDFRR